MSSRGHKDFCLSFCHPASGCRADEHGRDQRPLVTRSGDDSGPHTTIHPIVAFVQSMLVETYIVAVCVHGGGGQRRG